jgi:CBS domain-containing protein
MLLREILFHKGHQVATCSPQDTLAQAVSWLVQYNIGSLVVVEDDTMVGIITERDILRACDAGRGCITDQLVADQMTRSPLVGSPHHDAVEVMELMTNQRIRHLPVIDDGELIGIISMGDVVKAQSSEMARENYFLKSYIQS